MAAGQAPRSDRKQRKQGRTTFSDRFLLTLPYLMFLGAVSWREDLAFVLLGFRCMSFLRGTDRSATFFDDDDYRRFLTLLAEVGSVASVAVHA